MINGVIFDLDGVIVSTDKLHCLAWAETCKEWDIPFSEDINDMLRGVSRMESVDIILKYGNRELSGEEKASFADAKNKRYVDLLSTLTRKDLLPNIPYVIRELRNRKIKLAVGSSSKNATAILDIIGISDWFDAIVDGNCIHNSKPDPEVFILAAEALNVHPRNCIVVEDAESGIIAAKEAGCLAAAVGAAKGFGRADYELDRIEELLGVV